MVIITILVILLDNKHFYACYLLVLEDGDRSMYKPGLCFLAWDNLQLGESGYAPCALRPSKGQMAN